MDRHSKQQEKWISITENFFGQSNKGLEVAHALFFFGVKILKNVWEEIVTLCWTYYSHNQ